MELFIVIEEIMKVMQDRQQKAKLPNLFAKLQRIISENRLLEKFEEMRRQINLQKSLTEQVEKQTETDSANALSEMER
jgi:hypothetical protein